MGFARLRPRRAEPSETDRSRAFSDGVFAVAITLLALDLGRVHAQSGVGDGSLLAALRLYWPTLLAFAASFTVIGVAWTNDHNVLLERSTRRVSLTVAGTTFLDAIGPVIAAADEAIRRVRHGERAADALAIGFMPGLSLRHAMRTLMDDFPDATIEIRELTWANQADVVRDGTVDVALVRRPIDTAGLRLQGVVNDPRGVLLALDHPLAHKSSVSIAELAADPVIRHRHGGTWDAYWTVSPRPDGSLPVSGPMVENVPEKLAVVATGAAITFVPRSASHAYTHPGVIWAPVPDIEDSQVALAWIPGRRRRPRRHVRPRPRARQQPRLRQPWFQERPSRPKSCRRQRGHWVASPSTTST